MLVYAEVNLHTDVPYWFTRETFYAYFDQDDFLDRDIKEVQTAYLKDWFHTTTDGNHRFYIPVVGTVNGKTDLIGSRHRLAVLLPYLDELPIAVATADFTPEAQQFFDAIPKRALDQNQPFWIPDLPIRDNLP
jgi:hypothetical protein